MHAMTREVRAGDVIAQQRLHRDCSVRGAAVCCGHDDVSIVDLDIADRGRMMRKSHATQHALLAAR